MPGLISLADQVRAHARQRPDALAASCARRRITWGGLDDRSNRLAQDLVARGAGPGSRVAHLDVNAPEMPELLAATLKLGATLAPLNWRLSAPELRDVLIDAEADVLVCGADFAQASETAVQAAGVPTTVIAYGDEVPWAAADAVDPGHVTRPDDIALLHYTSGTTGEPKGVMLSAANVSAVAAIAPSKRRVHAGSRVLVTSPTFHVGGMNWVIAGMHAGAHLVLVPRVTPELVLDLLESERITTGLLVPTVLQAVTLLPDARERDLSSLETLGYGASPITSQALRRALETFACPLFQVYGQTETAGAVTQLYPEEHDLDGPRQHLLRSAGRAYDSVELRICGEDGSELPTGTYGEVCVRGDLVMHGYFNRPEETAEVLSEDGWLRTGDGGHLDEDGYLFLQDRVKDMIVTGAENVFPNEVEDVLARHPAIAEVAVIGLPHPHWIETVTAVVVPRAGGMVDPEELVAFARSDLAGYKLPRRVEIVDELPKGATGKVLKRELRRRFADSA